jgi:phenolic acid decarboxylase
MVHTAERQGQLDRLLGKHFIYTYESGWQYEIYVKNSTTFSYRIHSGMVAGRWVTDQPVHMLEIAPETYKLFWDEPTGTNVCITISIPRRQIHGAIVFPRWVADAPEKTVCHQNEHIDQMLQYRDAGPTYPKLVVDKMAVITFLEDCGVDRDDVIACPPSELPEGYTSRVS